MRKTLKIVAAQTQWGQHVFEVASLVIPRFFDEILNKILMFKWSKEIWIGCKSEFRLIKGEQTFIQSTLQVACRTISKVRKK